MDSYDVVVIGLGAMGSATAFQAVRRGVSVLGIDRFEPPHDNGSSHGSTRFTRLGTGEGVQYLPLVKRSHEIWRELEELQRVELFMPRGGLIIQSARSGEAMHGQNDFFGILEEVSEREGFEHHFLDAEQIGQRFPLFALDGGETGYYEPGAGVLRPEACIEAQLAQARSQGAVIKTNECVQSYADTGRDVVVVTDRGEYRAAKAVFCAGPWMGELFPEYRDHLQVYRQVVYWFEFESHAAYERYRSVPVFVWDSPAGLFYGFPAIDGRAGGLKVVTEQTDEPTSLDDLRRAFSTADHDEARRFYHEVIADRLPGLRPQLVRSEVCTYTVTPDQAFVIDVHPTRENLVLASPCSGHGFKCSAAIGEVLVDLATQGATAHDISSFSLARLRLDS